MDEEAPECHVCCKPCREPLQLTMDGEVTCLECVNAVTRLVANAYSNAKAAADARREYDRG